MNALSQPPKIEVSDIISQHLNDYSNSHGLSKEQWLVVNCLMSCRTSALGAHVLSCLDCQHKEVSYNSCRNRHCPKCQCLAKAEWLEKRKQEVVPVQYFHQVFTLPHELNELILYNKGPCLNLLFRSVQETLKAFAKDSEYQMNGTIGFMSILHTWDQKLNFHPHLHVVTPACALSEDKKTVSLAKKNFLFPVIAMSKKFRGNYLSGLKKLYRQKKLTIPPHSNLEKESRFRGLMSELYQKEWVVYSKQSFGSPEQLIGYLGRYTHRVAISNDRIFQVTNDHVLISYYDRKDQNKQKTLTIKPHEFLRRFLMHVLPTQFMKIRYYGFLAPKAKGEKLTIIRSLLKISEPYYEPKTKEMLIKEITGRAMDVCPKCNGTHMKSTSVNPYQKPKIRILSNAPPQNL